MSYVASAITILACIMSAAPTKSQDPDLRPEHARLAYSSTFKESTVTTMAADAVPILLKGCAKLMYTATLHVGDQYLDAVIDTGSSNLVLMGAECLGCSDTPRYRPGSTAVDLSLKAAATYSNSWHPVGAYGNIYLDSVSVPSMAAPNITSPIKMSFMSASISGLSSRPVLSCADTNRNATVQPDFPAIPGLLGLNTGQCAGSFMFDRGLEDLADDAFISALVKAGMRGMFAMHLCNEGGFLWLGNYDRNHVAARRVPEFVPIIGGWPPRYGHPYIVRMDAISIGGQELSTKDIASNFALVDTGNRFLELPSIAVKALNSSMSAALANARERGYNWSLSPGLPDCMLDLPREKEDLDSLLPDLTLWLYAGENTTVPLTMHASQSYMVTHLTPGGQHLWCLEVSDVGSSTGSIGLPVLRNFVTVFDLEKDMIGFAPPVLSKCPPVVPAPHPPPPPSPLFPWWAVLLCVLAACAGAAVLVFAGFAILNGRKRARSRQLRQQDSQASVEGNPLQSPLMDGNIS